MTTFHTQNTSRSVFSTEIIPDRVMFISSLNCTAFISMHSDLLPGMTFQSTFYLAAVDSQKTSKMFWMEHSQMLEGFPVGREKLFY